VPIHRLAAAGQRLAAQLGLSGEGYENTAVGGAKSDDTNVLPGEAGLRTQVDAFVSASPPVAGSALFAVWAGGPTTRFTTFSRAFNDAVAGQLDAFEAARHVSVLRLDVEAAFDQLLSDPSASGLENVSDGCTSLFDPAVRCDDPDAYLFWDPVHPTTRVHGFLAEQAFALLVPEPASGSLLAAGVLWLGLRGRGRRLACRSWRAAR